MKIFFLKSYIVTTTCRHDYIKEFFLLESQVTCYTYTQMTATTIFTLIFLTKDKGLV